jgi:hypothetical protein
VSEFAKVLGITYINLFATPYLYIYISDAITNTHITHIGYFSLDRDRIGIGTQIFSSSNSNL